MALKILRRDLLVPAAIIFKCSRQCWKPLSSYAHSKYFFPPTSTYLFGMQSTIINQPIRLSSTDSIEPPQVSKKDKLKRAVKEYGATVIVFHVSISLLSLGVTYLAVTSGVDMASLLAKIGIVSPRTETVQNPVNMLGTTGDVAAEVSTFVVAYAIHKMFAPVRISITLLCTPFIVRHLRKIGILKPPKPSIK